jgi:hypothetical protein
MSFFGHDLVQAQSRSVLTLREAARIEKRPNPQRAVQHTE